MSSSLKSLGPVVILPLQDDREMERIHMRLTFVAFSLIVLSSVLIVCPALPTAAQDQPAIVRKSAGVLQKEATHRVEPDYPPLARAARVAGDVTVEIVIDTEGNVVSATALSGHALLKNAAVVAARQWKFNPTTLSGVPVQVKGNIVFEFHLPDAKTSDTGTRPESIEELEKGVRDNPNSDEAHLDLARAYSKAGKNSNAISELKEAIRINPKSSEAHYKLALEYFNADRYQDAAVLFAQSIELDPDSLDNDAAYYALGLIHLKFARYDEAVKEFKESLKISPAVINTRRELGIAQFFAGDFKAAIEAFNGVLAEAPRHPSAHFWLGRAYLWSGDRERAMKQYKTLTELDRDKAQQLLNEISSRQ